VRTRSGDPYKPSALRAYEQALRGKLLPALGHLKLSSVTRNSVQDLVDRLVAEGSSASTVRNAVLPLRAIYRRALALSRSQVHLNPTEGLTLPAVRGRRDRVARPVEAVALLEALAQDDRAVWATSLYAGLRRGELAALRWADIDLERGLIRVERSWDPKAGPVEPKSRSGRRRVPLARPLRVHLAAHRLLLRRSDDAELLFGRSGGRAMHSDMLTRRAHTAWRRAGLEPIGLHECRHTYAAFMIAAGVNAKASRPTWATPRSPSPSIATGTSCPGTRRRPRRCYRRDGESLHALASRPAHYSPVTKRLRALPVTRSAPSLARIRQGETRTKGLE
jgi:integrase